VHWLERRDSNPRSAD